RPARATAGSQIRWRKLARRRLPPPSVQARLNQSGSAAFGTLRYRRAGAPISNQPLGFAVQRCPRNVRGHTRNYTPRIETTCLSFPRSSHQYATTADHATSLSYVRNVEVGGSS